MSDTHTLKTSIPGIFYRRPSPSEPVYVEVGQEVATGDIVGLVEIMKSFHSVPSDLAGTVVRFLVEDGAEVSPGQDIVELARS
ncbi:conserved hypothetical protein (plasmid) [Rhodococcus jostii RHA1]|jgi:biotin carboxyl carrier protein|uniref:Biotin carboxyl carrier protein of acetyl-CoA carboxylase n=1 Tax=Rhodococcus jostii (strain RHA1) TaxID=101510 RepID=Q0RVU7_RHOJR|nr:acetyl-CoA carboxylase [Rhodococcus jostii]ABH00589.1 conserved hypothetical protein [Rhodococcus jostii RHA1]